MLSIQSSKPTFSLNHDHITSLRIWGFTVDIERHYQFRISNIIINTGGPHIKPFNVPKKYGVMSNKLSWAESSWVKLSWAESSCVKLSQDEPGQAWQIYAKLSLKYLFSSNFQIFALLKSKSPNFYYGKSKIQSDYSGLRGQFLKIWNCPKNMAKFFMEHKPWNWKEWPS